MKKSEDVMLLNGSDWQAQYHLSNRQFNAWRSRGRNLENMLMDSAVSSGFATGAEDAEAMTGTIPGCDRSFLVENHQIPDPYFGRNLEKSAWSEKVSWTFRKWFDIPEEWRGSRIRIDFAGLDYAGIVMVNGSGLGEFKGAFIPVGWDITDVVKFGERNLVAVSFEPAPQGTPNHQDYEPADFAKFHRTQIGFGWDWGRKFVPTGIWGDVTVSRYERVRLVDWQAVAAGDGVDVTLELEVRHDGTEAPMTVALTSPDGASRAAEWSGIETLAGGRAGKKVHLPVANLQFWMPNGYGRQPLYELSVHVCGQELLRKNVGFKQLCMKRNPDSPEGAYPLLFNVGGQDIFVNGVNWVPVDMMTGHVQPEDYEYLVALAAQGGVNLFRMWGGGQLEKDSFYDACDRYGIMVWHEFYHACSNSPKNDLDYLAFKEREARSVLTQLRRHVCLSLICGGNEMQYYGEIPDAPVLMMYGRVAAEMVPGLPYHVSSPDLSRPGERPHGPWDFKEHEFYNRHNRVLASEYGCDAMPAYESLRKFIPAAECETLKGQALQYHFYNTAALRPGYAFDYALKKFQTENTEEYCEATMFAQADVARYMTEHYRRRFPVSSGCIFWQYNEPWPTCAWSIVDYYGVPKAAVYALRKASAPVLLSIEDDSWCTPEGENAGSLKFGCYCTVRGDVATGKTATAVLTLSDADGKALMTKSCDVSLAAGTRKIMDVEACVDKAGIVVARLEIAGVSSSERLFGCPDFRRYFQGRPDVRLTRTGESAYIVENCGRQCVFGVRLERLPGAPDMDHAFFTEDYLTLLPGEKHQVSLVKIGTGCER